MNNHPRTMGKAATQVVRAMETETMAQAVVAGEATMTMNGA